MTSRNKKGLLALLIVQRYTYAFIKNTGFLHISYTFKNKINLTCALKPIIFLTRQNFSAKQHAKHF